MYISYLQQKDKNPQCCWFLGRWSVCECGVDRNQNHNSGSINKYQALKKKHRILPKAEKSASALTEFNQRDFLLLPFWKLPVSLSDAWRSLLLQICPSRLGVIAVYIRSWDSLGCPTTPAVYWRCQWRLREKRVLLERREQLRESGSSQRQTPRGSHLFSFLSQSHLMLQDNPHPVLSACLMTLTLHLYCSYLLLLSAETPPPHPPSLLRPPTLMPPPWALILLWWCHPYGRYVMGVM